MPYLTVKQLAERYGGTYHRLNRLVAAWKVSRELTEGDGFVILEGQGGQIAYNLEVIDELVYVHRKYPRCRAVWAHSDLCVDRLAQPML